MSIETSHAPNSPKPTHAAHANHGKDKSLGPDTVGDGDGFLSLLLTLGGPDANATPLTVASDVLTPTGPAAPVDTSLLLGPSVPDPSAIPVLAAQAPAQPPRLQAAPLSVIDAAPGKNPVPAGSDLRAQEKTAEPLLMQEAPAEQEKTSSVDAAIGNELKDLIQAQQATHKLMAEQGNDKLSKGRFDEQVQVPKDLLTDRVEGQISSSLPQLTQMLGTTEAGPKVADRLKERLAFKPVGASEGGAWGYQALAQAGRIQEPTAVGATPGLPPEMMVAEQVNYWIGHAVQNAELRFDGLGEGTVKVHISMQGNEASVEFRSDQVQTRQILEGAVSHLKDLLGHEGLVLSNVSVGTSGSGGTNSRQAHPAAAPPAAAPAQVATLAVESLVRAPRASGHSVDLFV